MCLLVVSILGVVYSTAYHIQRTELNKCTKRKKRHNRTTIADTNAHKNIHVLACIHLRPKLTQHLYNSLFLGQLVGWLVG